MKNSLFRALPLRRISPSAPTLGDKKQDKENSASAVLPGRANRVNRKQPRAAPSYLPIDFWKEVKQLLLEVRWECIKGPGVYQSPQVCVDKNGTRRFKVNILTSVSFHLPCNLRAGKEDKALLYKNASALRAKQTPQQTAL